MEKFVRKTGVSKARLTKSCAVGLLTLALSTLACAQLPTGGDAFFGYSYIHGETFSNSRTVQATGGSAGMSGWEASVEGKYLPWLGAVADLDWHYGGNDTAACKNGVCAAFRLNGSRDTLLFGARASLPYGRFRVFGDALLGLAYQSDKGGGISNSDLTFASGFGGGVDYHLVRSVSLRAQAHAIHTSFFGRGQLDPRISAGVVFRF